MAFPVSASTRAAALKAVSWVGAEVSRADVSGAGTARAWRRFLVFAAWVFLVLIVVLLPKCCRPYSSNPVCAAAKRSPQFGGQNRDRPTDSQLPQVSPHLKRIPRAFGRIFQKREAGWTAGLAGATAAPAR